MSSFTSCNVQLFKLHHQCNVYIHSSCFPSICKIQNKCLMIPLAHAFYFNHWPKQERMPLPSFASRDEHSHTQLKTIRLLQYWWKQDWTTCAAHIVYSCQQCCTILLHPIQAQQYCSILLTSVNNVGRTTLFHWRNYYGFRPGKPGGPQPQWAKWGPPGSGCRAKTLAREASDMLQCCFLTIRVL
jgi:hypothetical protein